MSALLTVLAQAWLVSLLVAAVLLSVVIAGQASVARVRLYAATRSTRGRSTFVTDRPAHAA